MPHSSIQPVEKLQDQVHALQQLLLSLLTALDTKDRELVDSTLLIAAGQADAALAQGRPLAAIRIGALIEAVKECRQ